MHALKILSFLLVIEEFIDDSFLPKDQRTLPKNKCMKILSFQILRVHSELGKIRRKLYKNFWCQP